MARGYRDLIAWQKSMDLVLATYEATSSMSDSERFGLIAQMRRAAVSIPSNIAEGYGRRNRADFQRFIRNARGSLCELETQVELVTRLGLLNVAIAQRLAGGAAEVGRILNGLHSSLFRNAAKDTDLNPEG